MSPSELKLSPYQVRVLGALIEKEITTPEYYPLSLNALLNACNQKSSRDPVFELSQRDVLEALDGLEDLAYTASVHDGRVTKYEHRIRTVFQLRRDEAAVLCLLLLRGAQTPGEIRSRVDRLYTFDDLASVTATLDRLASRSAGGLLPEDAKTALATQPLVAVLLRAPGAREVRYQHLFEGPAAISDLTQNVARPSADNNSAEASIAEIRERLKDLELRVAQLEQSRIDR